MYSNVNNITEFPFKFNFIKLSLERFQKGFRFILRRSFRQDSQVYPCVFKTCISSMKQNLSLKSRTNGKKRKGRKYGLKNCQ